MSLQFPQPESIILPIQGSDNGFPVNHVYCVGRNYIEHIREMGVDVKEPPLFFSKPNWAVVKPGTDIDYPADTKNLNYEVEFVIAVGENMSIFGFGVGVDLTRRDLQTKAKNEENLGSEVNVLRGAHLFLKSFLLVIELIFLVSI